jgi:NAD(P)-dependent dehydrogenase (short-subunit alcohol dehydrogenase family)
LTAAVPAGAGELNGRVAIITGAAGGVGRSTSRLFADQGASLVLVDTDSDRLNSMARELPEKSIAVVVGDVTSAGIAQRTIDMALALFGRIDVLFNNAGMDRFGVTNVLGTEEADWDRIMEVNVKAAYLFSRAVLKPMIERRSGAIVTTGSVAGIQAAPAQTAYSVSKAAAIALSKCLAVDFGPNGIRSNCVCPGNLPLPMVERRSHLDDAALERRYQNAAAVTPLGRPGSYDEIAAAVLFLASDRSSYVNGAVLVVDGGWTTPVPRVIQPPPA